MSQPQIAIILYTVREPAKVDLANTLKRVRESGFEYVQWSGMPSLPADEIRAALDAAGLKAVAAHCGMEPFEKDLAAQVAFWNTVGAKDVAPGGMMGDCTDDRDAWLRGAARLDAIGAQLRDTGMRLSYHNHAHELELFPGDTMTKLDLLYSSTSPENLFAELDLCWLQVGGADPAAMIRKYANRCPLLHIKDMKTPDGPPVFCPVGQGCLDWDGIFDAVRESGVEWCIYEQDTCEGDVFDAVRQSYAFLSQHF